MKSSLQTTNKMPSMTTWRVGAPSWTSRWKKMKWKLQPTQNNILKLRDKQTPITLWTTLMGLQLGKGNILRCIRGHLLLHRTRVTMDNLFSLTRSIGERLIRGHLLFPRVTVNNLFSLPRSIGERPILVKRRMQPRTDWLQSTCPGKRRLHQEKTRTSAKSKRQVGRTTMTTMTANYCDRWGSPPCISTTLHWQ